MTTDKKCTGCGLYRSVDLMVGTYCDGCRNEHLERFKEDPETCDSPDADDDEDA
jgi:hypothetical protein